MNPTQLPTPDDLPPLDGIVAASLANHHYEIPFSREGLELLLRYISAFYPLRTACALCGLDESSLDRWCHGSPDVRRAIDVAVEAARVPALNSLIERAKAGDSAAWTVWLRHSSAGQFDSAGSKTLTTRRSKHLLEGGTMVFDGELPKIREGYKEYLDSSYDARLLARKVGEALSRKRRPPANPHAPSAPAACRSVDSSPPLRNIAPKVVPVFSPHIPSSATHLAEITPPCSPTQPTPPLEFHPELGWRQRGTQRAQVPAAYFIARAAAQIVAAFFLFAALIGSAGASNLNPALSAALPFSTASPLGCSCDVEPVCLSPHLPDPVYPVPILQ